jgi:ribose-phosphate pyrophosphokinase
MSPLRDPVVVSPDAGGVERARAIAKRLNAGLAIIDKRREGPNAAGAMHLIGDVRDRYAIVIDDMIDTAGTLGPAVGALEREGARRILACGVHPVLSGPAAERRRSRAARFQGWRRRGARGNRPSPRTSSPRTGWRPDRAD